MMYINHPAIKIPYHRASMAGTVLAVPPFRCLINSRRGLPRTGSHFPFRVERETVKYDPETKKQW